MSLETGIESTDISAESSPSTDNTNSELADSEDTSPIESCDSNPDSPSVGTSEMADRDSQKNINQRRALLNEKLKNYKQEKLKRKIPVDSQLLACAQEEVKVKKQLLDRLDTMDKEYNDSMKSLSSNIEKLTNCITDVFSVFKTSMTPQPYMPQMGSRYHQQPMGYHPQLQNEYNYTPGTSTSSNTSGYSQFNYLDHDESQY